MKIINLDSAKILAAAKVAFPKAYIEQDTVDFYLPDIEKGELRITEIDHPIYVNTHYAYEDRMVNVNQTRYKVHVNIIYVKKDPYEVLYDARSCCYVAYEEKETIQFIVYADFYDKIRNQIEILENN